MPFREAERAAVKRVLYHRGFCFIEAENLLALYDPLKLLEILAVKGDHSYADLVVGSQPRASRPVLYQTNRLDWIDDVLGGRANNH